jgi:hypothetical protein
LSGAKRYLMMLLMPVTERLLNNLVTRWFVNACILFCSLVRTVQSCAMHHKSTSDNPIVFEEKIRFNGWQNRTVPAKKNNSSSIVKTNVTRFS